MERKARSLLAMGIFRYLVDSTFTCFDKINGQFSQFWSFLRKLVFSMQKSDPPTPPPCNDDVLSKKIKKIVVQKNKKDKYLIIAWGVRGD